jgi:CRP-like cAMP-binding protein
MVADKLPNNGFLSNASDDLKRVLDALATEVRLQPGEVLFEQGDEGQALYAVESGVLEISILSRDGRKLALDVMRPGALFGEIALFDPGKRTATVTALEATTLRQVKNADILREVERTPKLAIDLIKLAGLRMRWMNRQFSEQVFLPMPSRLARKVLHLTIEGGTAPAMLALSQAELAEFVGATREAVSKTLSAWKRLGIIDASRRGLVVLDRDALQLIADLDLI